MPCRICGLKQADPPWGEDGNSPTYVICDCCGVEFGYEDSTTKAVQRFRELWLERGAPWFRQEAKPVGWDLDCQLSQVPSGWR